MIIDKFSCHDFSKYVWHSTKKQSAVAMTEFWTTAKNVYKFGQKTGLDKNGVFPASTTLSCLNFKKLLGNEYESIKFSLWSDTGCQNIHDGPAPSYQQQHRKVHIHSL